MMMMMTQVDCQNSVVVETCFIISFRQPHQQYRGTIMIRSNGRGGENNIVKRIVDRFFGVFFSSWFVCYFWPFQLARPHFSRVINQKQ